MTGESFFEYVANVFVPWLTTENIQRPVVLFVDGHCSHLTMALSDFCSSHNIILIALYPNATHILQPLDIAFFRPLKGAWRKSTHQWRMDNTGNRLRKEFFAPLLAETLKTLNVGEILASGFKTCGLYPFSADAVNYKKIGGCSSKSIAFDTTKQIHQETDAKDHLKYLEIPFCDLELDAKRLVYGRYVYFFFINFFSDIESERAQQRGDCPDSIAVQGIVPVHDNESWLELPGDGTHVGRILNLSHSEQQILLMDSSVDVIDVNDGSELMNYAEVFDTTNEQFSICPITGLLPLQFPSAREGTHTTTFDKLPFEIE